MAPWWSTSLKTAPATEPVSLAEAKLHCRVDTDVTDEDTLLTNQIVAAREYAESCTNRAFITQTWYLKLDDRFPCGGAIVLPRPPLASVTAVSYVDPAGVTQAWAAGATGYQLVAPAGPKAQYARIVPSYGIPYPVTRCQPEAVTVEYVCGYGAASAVPDAIKAAMLLLIGHWFTHREVVVVGTITSTLQLTVEALLAPYAVDRW